MGMLMAMTMQKQKDEAARKLAESSAKEEVKAEEIPFTEPEEPVAKPERKPSKKPATVTRRRKPVK